ncbi:hypothetical protein LI90_2832 [Carbonactinospora thermoautotrophica]|uniref:Secreted protein n=1 Tax=Carbonactinospora thermoautotrophica TaxID=1469144 RepID=A0A132MVT0_9ACTN|nr:hypothetical protein LI90_2832 [Carbonactinospora thermoautotrophica]
MSLLSLSVSRSRPRSRHRSFRAAAAVAALLAGLVPLGASDPAYAKDVEVFTSSLKGSDGKTYSVTNHLRKSLADAVSSGSGTRREWLVVWAGDANAADTTGGDLSKPPLSVDPPKAIEEAGDLLPGADFLAVIDATKGSPTYGKVVNTVTVGPLLENEPHHMQYVWHKGDKIYAGGLFSDATYVFDVTRLPQVRLVGVNLPQDTLCGSVPDAFWVLKDGTAYGTYMGGPDVPGPCVYSNGEIRVGNGFAGSPGEVVRIGPDGRTLAEAPAASKTPEAQERCESIPELPVPTCANPHGVQVREDLNRMVTSDYVEPRNIILDPVKAPSSYIRRPTVRVWDISDRNRPTLKSVSFLPDGPRHNRLVHHEENRAAMETTVTNQPGHRGAFASTMSGGAIYYTPDITADKPQWREVFDITTANKAANPGGEATGAGSGGGWLQTSPDDRFLFHAVIGRSPGTLGEGDTGSPGMVFVLDIQKLVAAGTKAQCRIDELSEVYDGGREADCPALVSVLPLRDDTSGGPHWGALDNFRLGSDGYYHETTQPRRLATSNYFVARTGIDGNHQVCVANIDPAGRLSLDTSFRDENKGTPCVDFNRTHWPHGNTGSAKPHSMLFVIADEDVR